MLEPGQGRALRGQGEPEATVRGEFGPRIVLHPGGKASTVHCTYLRDTKPGKVSRKRQNLSVASQLLRDFVAVDSLAGLGMHGNLSRIGLEYDELGKPRLKIGESMGMAVSFSRVSDMIWAALSGPGNHLGLDVARAEEFEGDYPFHRAFHPEELRSPMIDAYGIRETAAVLWSVKEAVVKALGIGFGLLGPLDIRVESMEDRATHYVPRISMARGALRGTGPHPPPGMNIISFSHAGIWASVVTRQKIHDSSSRNSLTQQH